MIATWFGAQWSGMASRFSFDQFHSIGQACAAAVVKDGQEDGPEDHKDQEKPPKEKVKKG